MQQIRSRFTVSLLTLVTLAATLSPAASGTQPAAASPYRGSSGLALHHGATLAPPKILGLGSEPVALSRVVEDQSGAERRQDTNTEVTYGLQAEVLFAKDSARLSASARSRNCRDRSGDRTAVGDQCPRLRLHRRSRLVRPRRRAVPAAGTGRADGPGRRTPFPQGHLHHPRVWGDTSGGFQRHGGRPQKEPAGRELVSANRGLTVPLCGPGSCADETSECTELQVDIRFRK